MENKPKTVEGVLNQLYEGYLTLDDSETMSIREADRIRAVSLIFSLLSGLDLDACTAEEFEAAALKLTLRAPSTNPRIAKLRELVASAPPSLWGYYVPEGASINPSRAAFLVGPERRSMDHAEGYLEQDAALIAAACPLVLKEVFGELDAQHDVAGIQSSMFGS